MSGGEWQTKFNVSPGPGLWSLVLGPYGPDLGPDLDLTWDLDLDLSLTIEMIYKISGNLTRINPTMKMKILIKSESMKWLQITGRMKFLTSFCFKAR